MLDEPAFEYRVIDFIGGHNGLPGSQPRYWQESEWKHAIDWMLKNRINVASLILANPNIPVLAGVFEEAFPELKTEQAEGLGGEWDYPIEYRKKMMQNVLEYGRSHGLRFLYRYEYAAIPQELLKLRPQMGGLMLDAGNPEHRQVILSVGKAALKLYGTDHLYSVQYAGEDPSLKELTSRGVAMGADVIRELDPDYKKKS